ncbi:MAG: type III-B CRISPR-associated protein Cas10/Cmr2 [Methylococcaceae bacterium]|nr:type III-B CRISPR-associated protein Cas10/Cmr2 [Methylococcaceae bacterium]
MNEEHKQYFHFTLGPVQSFVAQARRTRDFWAGSFLLSWLSAVAIKAVEQQNGKLLFPKVDADYLDWLENKGSAGAPQQGCIPNRFKGGLAEVPENFNPQQVVESINLAWQGLAEKIWEKDLEEFLSQNKEDKLKTHEIWARQVDDFWEISWALTEDTKQSNLLDRRKNWRSYLPPEEAGVKCMMMDGWQELSGIETPNSKDLDLFWKTLRKTKGNLEGDLRKKEYLCAIAFIKRRFAHYFKDFKQVMPNGWTLHGWEVTASVPSVSYIAAAPWLAKVLEHAPEETLLNFHDEARKLTKSYGECKTNLECIDKVIRQKQGQEHLTFWRLKSLDGDVFFESLLDNKNRHEDQQQAQEVKKSLIALRKSVKNLEAVSPFYAVLMMDGDSLGIQMSDLDKQKAISESLNHFTRGVNSIIEQHSGFLIYAGGDDVLALLPLEKALDCAYELRQYYLQCFADNGGFECANGDVGRVVSTLSGAIEYAHIKMPLARVLADAHHLLDDIAKEGCGRDSIAVRVWKTGGQHLQWAMPWKYAANEEGVIIEKIANDFRDVNKETPFSKSFFYNIDERFSMLQNENAAGKMELAEGFSKDNITQLIAAEFLNSGVNSKREQKFTLEKAIEHIQPLLEQCMPIKRILNEDGTEKFDHLNHLNIDAAHLVAFLVKKGVENG